MGKVITRVPMTIKMRAKQFTMFDALKGLKEAIAAEEHKSEQRRYLTQESINEINDLLTAIQTKQIVRIEYYGQQEGKYLQLTGTVMKVDAISQKLQIDNIAIDFSDIIELSLKRRE